MVNVDNSSALCLAKNASARQRALVQQLLDSGALVHAGESELQAFKRSGRFKGFLMPLGDL